MELLDIKGAAAVLADHLAQNGAPVAKELLEEGLAKVVDSLKDRETQFTDWLDARLETHRARITMPADGKGGVVVEWELKEAK